MGLFNFIFQLGVLFAIYGFLWGIFEIIFRILVAGSARSVGQVYLMKAVKYFFLADVTFLFCLDQNNVHMVVTERVVVAGLVLLTYFMGKLQNSQNRILLTQFVNRGVPNVQAPLFNMRGEIAVIFIALLIFGGFWFFPQYAANPLSVWFREAIIDIENTAVIGFIFKVIGFFFLLTLIFRMVGAFGFLLSGGKTNRGPGPGGGFRKRRSNNQDKESGFSDYEEVD